MVICFLHFHQTKVVPKKVQYPVMDLWESQQPAQFESKKEDSWRVLCEGKNNPDAGSNLT